MLSPSPLTPQALLRVQADEVRAFLLDPGAPAAPETLRAAGLAPFAYCALPAHDPRRNAVRADYLRSLGRHAQLRREVAQLVRAWADAGIEALQAAAVVTPSAFRRRSMHYSSAWFSSACGAITAISSRTT